MENEFQRHKASDKIKWFLTGVAFLLVFVFLAGLCMQLFGNDKLKPSNWFTKTECVHDYDEDGKCINCGEDKSENEDDKEKSNNLLATPENIEGAKMSIVSMPMTTSLDDSAPIQSRINNFYWLKATVSPVNSDVTDFTWSASWIGSTGADVNDYIDIRPVSGKPLEVYVYCLSTDFWLPISVTCTYDYDTSIKASCRFDCVARIDNIELEYEEYLPSNCFWGDMTTGISNVDYCDGTVYGTVRAKRFYGEFSTAFYNSVTSSPYYSRWIDSQQVDDLVFYSGSCDIYDSIALVDEGDYLTVMCDLGQFVFVDNAFGVDAYRIATQKSDMNYLNAACYNAAKNTTNNFRVCMDFELVYNGEVVDTYKYVSPWHSLSKDHFDNPYTTVSGVQLNQSNFVF